MICPKCGATLPDTAELCWSCRKQFNTDSENPSSDPIQKYKLSFKPEEETKSSVSETTTQDNPAPVIEEPEPEKYVPFNNIKRKSYMFKACLLGLAGVLFLGMLHYKVLMNFISGVDYMFTPFFLIYNGLLLIADLILLLYSIPGRKYVKSDGLGKMLICIIGMFIPIILNAITYNGRTTEIPYAYRYTYYMNKILLYFGYGFNLISGIMIYAAGYTKDEKEKMRNNI